MRISKTSDFARLANSMTDYVSASLDAEDGGHIQLHGTGAVKSLESKIAAYCGVRHAVAVSNCTTGLMAVALALELQDSEIIVPPLVYGGSISGLLLLGNRLRFCDVEAATLTLDPNAVRRAVGRNTRAILAVDLFGVPSDTYALRQIADDCGIPLICDCAQSLGATLGGSPIGQTAHASVLSFTSGKTLFAGEGGAILTNDTNLYRKLLWLTQHPHRQRRELGLAVFNELNLNARIHPLGAIWADAMFDTAIESIKEWQQRCLEEVAFLNTTGLTETCSFANGTVPAFFRRTAVLKPETNAQQLKEVMIAAGRSIEIQEVPVRPIYLNGAFQALRAKQAFGVGGCPIAERESLRKVAIRDLR